MRHARYRGDRLAVIFGEQRLNWAEFNAQVNQLANALQARGIGKDDKLATALPNSMELLVIYWATVSIGAVLVPLSPLLNGAGLINLVNNADVRLLFLTPALREEIDTRRGDIPNISSQNYILVDDPHEGHSSYSAFVADCSVEPLPDQHREDGISRS